MNIYKQLDTTQQLRNAYQVRPGKRFISFFIDFVLISLVAYCLSFGSYAIAKNSTAYQTAQAKVQEEIKYYNNYIAETHLVSFTDDEKTTRKDSDVLVLENISKAIYHSYKTYDENANPKQYSDYEIKEDSSLAKYGESSLINDDLSYFYTVYIPSSGSKIVSYQGENPGLYLNNLYKNSNISSLFNYGESDTIPTLYSNVAYSLFIYLTQEKNSVNETVYTEGQNNYNTFYNAYSSLLSNAESLCIKDEPYYSEHYLPYKEYISEQGRVLNIALLVTLVISYLLVTLIPKLIFGYDRTFGRLFLSLYTTNEDIEKPKWYYTATKEILGVFGYMLLAVVFYILPPFNGVFDPMFTGLIGNLSLFYILIIIGCLLAINVIPCLFTKNRETLLEKVFKFQVRDKKTQSESTDE